MCTDNGAGEARRRGAGWLLPACTALVLAGLPAAAPAEGDSVKGTTGVSLRYRLEQVFDDGPPDDATASTLRLRLNHRTAPWRGWQAFAEFDYVAEVLADDYNSGAGTSPSRENYAVVADPDGADLNQLYVDYAPVDGLRLRVGRQRLLLNNQRLVGGVGWRQNEQTYDAVMAELREGGPVGLRYAYFAKANRIFGDDVPAGRHAMRTHLLDGRWALPGDWELTPYALYVDNRDVASSSTFTLGARVAGKVALGELPLALSADLASQADAADNPRSYRASYLRLDASLSLLPELSLGAGFERLGGNASAPGEAYRTPLATLHAFQGWADQFLASPDAGIEDRFVTLDWRPAPWRLQVRVHQFDAASGDAHWGRELDVAFGRRLDRRHAVLFKAAHFEARNAGFRDTTKVWLMLSGNY